jgi:hypothetical protein
MYKCTSTSAGTETDCSKTPNFLSADERDVTPSNHPVAVPDVASSPNYSYEMWLRLKCIVAPNSQCTNFKFWGPATQPDSGDTPGNEMTVMAGTTGTGATPTDSGSTVAATAQHSNYNGPDPGSHLAIGVVPADSKIDAVNEYTNYLVLQLKVEDEAQRGDIAQIPFSIEYDES